MIKLILLFLIFTGLLGNIYWKLAPKDNNLEQRLKALENSVVSTRAQLAGIQSPAPSSSDLESRVKSLEQTVSGLKNQTSQVSTYQQKSPAYIPLGAGGTAGDKGWYSMPGYEVIVDPADYSGYSGMQMEINFRMTEIAGVGMARLYNQTDNTAASGEITIASDNFSLQVIPVAKLPSGKKTYRLQIKSTYGANLEIQSARIKVSF